MLNPFEVGDQKVYNIVVHTDDIAQFPAGGIIHHVYSTFAITRDAEWACRLFINEMLEPDEEGIGTFVHVDHHAPAKVGASITVVSTFEEIRKNELVCSFEALNHDRLIASGKTGQKILKKSRLKEILSAS